MEGSRAKDWGKELGQIHEGIITLRNLGLTSQGWQKMTTDAELARRVVELVEGQKDVWLEKILVRERVYHLAFFGREFDLTAFADTLRKYGENKIRFWQKLGLEPAFLPAVSLDQRENYLGWKIKPELWFYDQVAAGKIFRDTGSGLKVISEVKLEGLTVLIDPRLKPAYKDGKQMWQYDRTLGSFVGGLRSERKIDRYEYGVQNSRFGVSADEWENFIKPAWAGLLQLGLNQIRLETAEEANVIPQIYSYMPRKADGQTDTGVWYEQYFKGRGGRLDGGDSGSGGLARVRDDAVDDHWDRRSFRPLAVL